MVEYGADLHTMDHGSGFPTLTSKHLRLDNFCLFIKVFFSITPVRFHSVRVRDWEKKHLANSDMDSQCFSIYDFPKLHDDSFQSTSIVDSGTFSIFCLFC